VTFLSKNFLTYYGYLNILTLRLFLNAGHSQKMTGQVTPQAPVTSAQSADAGELQSLRDQHRYIEVSNKLIATDPTHQKDGRLTVSFRDRLILAFAASNRVSFPEPMLRPLYTPP
jgi:hypothetical protein